MNVEYNQAIVDDLLMQTATGNSNQFGWVNPDGRRAVNEIIRLSKEITRLKQVISDMRATATEQEVLTRAANAMMDGSREGDCDVEVLRHLQGKLK